MKRCPKLIHGLTISDIDPKDRQNYSSYEKITSIRVRNALSEHFVGSEATVKYLEKCDQITSSFMQDDLMPLDRVYRIFNAVFFFRIWSSWLKSSHAYKTDENLITSNCYKCIEINAMNLISLMKQFRDENAHSRFLPTLFGSQTCENMFRHFRSMGTANFTKINFTMFEILNMTRHVEIKNEIDQYKLSNVDIIFPRTSHVTKTKVTNLPTDEEIEQKLALAKEHAFEEAHQFQLSVNTHDVDDFQLPTPKFRHNIIETEEENTLQSSDDDIDLIDLSAEFCTDDICSTFVDPSAVADQCTDENENSSYTLISNEKGVVNRIRKSAIVWALSTPTQKLSNDRLNRVKASAPKVFADTETSLHRIRKNTRKATAQAEKDNIPESYVQHLDIMEIGEWCFFQNRKSEPTLIGVVLGFQYAQRKTVKDKCYARDSVSFSDESTKKSIEVLCTFYHFSQSGILNSFPNNHFHLKLSMYIATLVGITPTVQNEKIFFNHADFVIVKENLEHIQ